jgi:triosephosphate isomerase
MNKTNAELAEYFAAFPKIPNGYKNTIVFCPPSTGLHFVSNVFPPTALLGVQNIHHENNGAFTGEISALMAADCGAKLVIAGHSERRAYFGEDDITVNKKIISAINCGLTAILCIGENGNEKAARQTNNVLSKQINNAIRGITDLSKIIIAYEPVWAVGSGTPASEDEISAVIRSIRTIIQNIPIIYGGSVNEHNAKKILSINGIDGVLVGGACLNPEKFAKICGLIPHTADSQLN